VLIHGSWHGGWAWDAVINNLVEKAHRTDAPTLPGYGPGGRAWELHIKTASARLLLTFSSMA
jgi:hypothetical protein